MWRIWYGEARSSPSSSLSSLLILLQCYATPPLALKASKCSMKPGRCFSLQVGVKAPGTEISTAFLCSWIAVSKLLELVGKEYSPSAFTSMMSTLISGIDGAVAEDMISTLQVWRSYWQQKVYNYYYSRFSIAYIIIRALALHICGHQDHYYYLTALFDFTYCWNYWNVTYDIGVKLIITIYEYVFSMILNVAHYIAVALPHVKRLVRQLIPLTLIHHLQTRRLETWIPSNRLLNET